MSIEATVNERYSEGAKEKQEALCCPVKYDKALLAILPQEIIEKDYGCGDPSRYVKSGDTVLDLGSGGGKMCYIVAQLVGEGGRIIGVDMNDDMLALARKYQAEMAGKLGENRVTFLKGYIQDLALDLAATEQRLVEHPVRSNADLFQLQAWQAAQRRERPLIPDASVDLVISNCVLNLVRDEDKKQLVREVFRVLKPGGRIAISDIVSDETVPETLKRDAALWTGCISGAFQEEAFVRVFLDAGFVAACYDEWDGVPWRVIDGIEFRSVTLTAVKGEAPGCLDRGHAVIYRGPYASVSDDENHVYPRGARMAVCERTYRFLMDGPYSQDFIGIEPQALREPVAFCAPPGTRRPAAETKGSHHSCCGGGEGSCCQ